MNKKIRTFYLQEYTKTIYDFGDGPLHADELLKGFLSILDTVKKEVGTPKEYVSLPIDTRQKNEDLYKAAEYIYQNLGKLMVKYEQFTGKEKSMQDLLITFLNPYKGFQQYFWDGLTKKGLNPDGVKRIYSYKIHELAQKTEWQACKWLYDIDLIDKISFEKEPTPEEKKALIQNGYRVGKAKITLGEKKHPFKIFPFAITFDKKLNLEKIACYWQIQGGQLEKHLQSLRVFDGETLAFVFGRNRILFDKNYSDVLIDYLKIKPLKPNT